MSEPQVHPTAGSTANSGDGSTPNIDRGRMRRAAHAARARIRAARQAQNVVSTGVFAKSSGDAGFAAAAPNAAAEHAGRGAGTAVPYGLRLSAAWMWRLLILAAGGFVLLWLVSRLSQVLIPMAIALLLSALLAPAVSFLRARAKMPPSLATAVVLFGGLLAAAGTLTLVITQFVRGAPQMGQKAVAGLGQIEGWIHHGPLGLSTKQLDDTLGAAGTWLHTNQQAVASGAFATATAGI